MILKIVIIIGVVSVIKGYLVNHYLCKSLWGKDFDHLMEYGSGAMLYLFLGAMTSMCFLIFNLCVYESLLK